MRVGLAVAVAVVTLLGLAQQSSATMAGSGTLRVDYLFLDQTGNYSLNQETFNTYPGLGLSLERFRYDFQNGMLLSADLTNLTLNNRNLSLRFEKTGRFRLDLGNHQYRRVYSPAGDHFTKRQTSSARLTVNVTREIEIYGGVRNLRREGTWEDALAVTNDATAVKWQQTSLTAGARAAYRFGSLNLTYEDFDVTHDEPTDPSQVDRTAQAFRVDGTVPMPFERRLVLSGGYHYRNDETPTPVQLKTDLGWGALRYDLPRNYRAEYRLVFGRTLNSATTLETDNAINTVTLAKAWGVRYGARLGYENRIADDLTDRTESHGLLASAWGRFGSHWDLRGALSLRDRDVVDGATLMGNGQVNRYRLSARYRFTAQNDLAVQWSGRTSRHDPVPLLRDSVGLGDPETRVNYQVIATSLNLKSDKLGRLKLSYNYYVGQYQNNSTTTDYEFSDHLFQAALYSPRYHNFEAEVSGVYYRSQRDQDTEKFSLGFGAAYRLTSGYVIGATYDVFNADDLLFVDEYYTANIVRVYVAKDLTF